MGRIILIAVAIAVMIAGGAVGIMKQLKIGPFAVDEATAAAAAAAPVDPMANKPRFVNVAPLVISVFAGDQVLTTIQIEVKLETRGSENVAKLQKIEPRINNAFLQEMSSFIPRVMAKNEGMPLNVTLVKQRLKLVADRVVGDGIVNGVLVQSVLDRRNQ